MMCALNRLAELPRVRVCVCMQTIDVRFVTHSLAIRQ